MPEEFNAAERRALEKLRRKHLGELTPGEEERLRQIKEGYSTPENPQEVDPLRDVPAAYTILNKLVRKASEEKVNVVTHDGSLIKKSIHQQTPAGEINIEQFFSNPPLEPIYVTITTLEQGYIQKDSFMLNNAGSLNRIVEHKDSTGKVISGSQCRTSVSQSLSKQDMTDVQRRAVFDIHKLIGSIAPKILPGRNY